MTSIPGPFDFSKMAAGGFGQMLDGVEMVKRAWSNFNVPSAMLPTVDLNELDKRIADLKAVEQWLNVNQSMLHNAIQGLEIQRGTLAAIRAFTEQAGMPPPMAAAPFKAANPTPKASPFSTDGWPMKPQAARTDSEAAAKPAQAAARPTPQEMAPEQPQDKAQAPDAPAQTASAPGIDPGAWWTMLQNSFSSSAEYQAIYIGQQNTVLITKLYQNLFGRVVDVNDGGVQWWAGEMDAGRHTITTIAGALSSGTTPGSADNIAITNKITAATAFTNALNTNAETENYVGTAAFAIASNWLAPIRDDNILATSLASRDATIASAVATKTVLVNATGTANASQGVVTFELAAASFDYTISGFGVGDRIDFPTGAEPTLTNASYSDGQVNLMWSAGGNNVLIKLVGLSGTQDSQLNTLADFNTVFGIGSVY
jgi:hypothetical protein